MAFLRFVRIKINVIYYGLIKNRFFFYINLLILCILFFLAIFVLSQHEEKDAYSVMKSQISEIGLIRANTHIELFKNPVFQIYTTLAIVPISSSLNTLLFLTKDLKINKVLLDGEDARFKTAEGITKIVFIKNLDPTKVNSIKIYYELPYENIRQMLTLDGLLFPTGQTLIPFIKSINYKNKLIVSVPNTYKVVSNLDLVSLDEFEGEGKYVFNTNKEASEISLLSFPYKEIKFFRQLFPLTFNVNNFSDEDIHKWNMIIINVLEYFTRKFQSNLLRHLTVYEIPKYEAFDLGADVLCIGHDNIDPLNAISIFNLVSDITRKFIDKFIDKKDQSNVLLSEVLSGLLAIYYIKDHFPANEINKVFNYLKNLYFALKSYDLSFDEALINTQNHNLARTKGTIFFYMLSKSYSNDFWRKYFDFLSDKQSINLSSFKKLFDKGDSAYLDILFWEWLNKKSCPEFSIEYNVKQRKNEKSLVFGKLSQKAPAYNLNLIISLVSTQEKIDKDYKLTGEELSFDIEFNGTLKEISLDPDNLILNEAAKMIDLNVSENAIKAILKILEKGFIENIENQISSYLGDTSINNIINNFFKAKNEQFKFGKFLVIHRENSASANLKTLHGLIPYGAKNKFSGLIFMNFIYDINKWKIVNFSIKKIN
ncbi:MAG: hypothetical protein ABIA04_01020 [Pseudomonadota bacterium]